MKHAPSEMQTAANPVPQSPKAATAKMAIGTAQFGMPYGISNRAGKVELEEAIRILAKAAQTGVTMLDTAEAYGDSESVLGDAMVESGGRFDVVSKFSREATVEDVEARLDASLRRLRIPSLAGYLAHSSTSLMDKRLVDALRRFRDDGRIGQYGASVYRPEEVEALLAHETGIGLVQLPFNIVDQRFSSLLPRLKARGVEVHARSAYLQGLLLLDDAGVPPALGAVRACTRQLRECARERGVSLQALLLNAVATRPHIDAVVVGMTSIREFEENATAREASEQCLMTEAEYAQFALSDEQILIPANWTRN